MTIRKANIKDIKQVAQLFDEYRVFYKKESDIEAAIQFLSQRLENDESVIFIAEEESVLKGFVQLYPIFSSTQMKRLWLLNDLYVNSNYRGQGISIQLIDKAKELAINTHSAGLMLETAKTNDIGNKLYPRAGFELDTDHNFYSWNP